MSKSGIRWDEGNLAENEEYALNNPKMKIEEPKTPFHKLDESEAELDVVEPASQDRQLQAGIHDLAALSAAALERREAQDEPEDDPQEKRRKFEQARKGHYQTGGLAALRAQAAQEDEEEEDDDDEDEGQKG